MQSAIVHVVYQSRAWAMNMTSLFTESRWFYLSLSRLHFSTIQISVHLVAKMAILLCSPVPRRATNGTTINSHPARWRPSSPFWMRRHVAARAASLVSLNYSAVYGVKTVLASDDEATLCHWFAKLRPLVADAETALHKLNQIMTRAFECSSKMPFCLAKLYPQLAAYDAV